MFDLPLLCCTSPPVHQNFEKNTIVQHSGPRHHFVTASTYRQVRFVLFRDGRHTKASAHVLRGSYYSSEMHPSSFVLQPNKAAEKKKRTKHMQDQGLMISITCLSLVSTPNPHGCPKTPRYRVSCMQILLRLSPFHLPTATASYNLRASSHGRDKNIEGSISSAITAGV